MASLNVENYSREVIENYRQNGNHMPPNTARATTIAAAATLASDQGKAAVGDAAKVARNAIDAYEKMARNGVPLDQAREKAARSMSEQFDNRGREVRKQERERSDLISL
jgi:hypothetical protein